MGSTEKVLIAYCDMIENHYLYLAQRFEASMKGLGTNEKRLNSLLSRWKDGDHLKHISAAYRAKFGKSLIEKVKGEVGGDYCKLALAILKE